MEKNNSDVLVTGGAGFIGSHSLISLINNNYNPIIIDNLSNSSIKTIHAVEKITAREIKFYKLDLLNVDELEEVFKDNDFSSVVHFAGLKSVGESVSVPLHYFRNNILGTINVLDLCNKYGINKFIFSSSASVYGNNENVPLKEDSELLPLSPYAYSKLIIENMLTSLCSSNDESSSNNWKIIMLRYFNPIGAHESGLISEKVPNIPPNIMPLILRVAFGEMNELSIYGNDYETTDGTGVRDYIHVMDLADGHVAALNNLYKTADKENFCKAINLGTGQGYTVLELIKYFIKYTGTEIPYRIVDRRSGDIGSSFANAEYAKHILQWEAKRDIKSMILDSWNAYKYQRQ